MSQTNPPVHPLTIAQFASQSHSTEELFAQFFKDNEAAALYLRRRLIKLYPDVEARALASRVALEIASILNRDVPQEQAKVADLERLRQLFDWQNAA